MSLRNRNDCTELDFFRELTCRCFVRAEWLDSTHLQDDLEQASSLALRGKFTTILGRMIAMQENATGAGTSKYMLSMGPWEQETIEPLPPTPDKADDVATNTPQRKPPSLWLSTKNSHSAQHGSYLCHPVTLG